MTTRLPDPTPQALRSAQRLQNLLGAAPPPPAPAERRCRDGAPDRSPAPIAPRDGRSP
ncbi:hypothetical protein GKJPGBOP_01445 [Streptomyces paromomycinus]|uniref:Uncharacterized protein n=1 Tax=Streptomyces paromomycinus TaxID=92743 RepID=A0A401VXI7_STREY|nr:hypothetical protein GKJPGBOP_01445 [Streptomyces paromomycinus]